MKRNLFRALPLANVLRDRLGFARSLPQAAVKTEVLQDRVEEEIAPAICLPNAIDRVTGTWPNDNLDQQLERAKQSIVSHAPVIRYSLENCITGPDGLEFVGGAINIAQKRRALVTPPLEEIDRGCFCMTVTSRLYFGHYLREACTAGLLAKPDEMLLLEARPEWPDAVAYTKAFGLKTASIKHRFVRKLSAVSDYGNGPHNTKRLKELRQSAHDMFGARDEATERVYFRRPGLGAARPVAQEQRLMDELSARGFRIIDPVGLSLQQLADAFRNAKLVLTMEGSHVNHVYFLAPVNVSLCLLIPSDTFGIIHRFMAHALDIPFGFHLCDPSADGYLVDADAAMKTIDLFD